MTRRKEHRPIDVAMYSFTDRELAEELASLARKGIHIRVYRDREQRARLPLEDYRVTPPSSGDVKCS